MKLWGRVGWILVSVAVISGCRQKDAPSAPVPPSQKVSVAGRNFATHWQTEPAYFVETITHDLALMAAFASDRSASPERQIKYDIMPVAEANGEATRFRIITTLPGQEPFETQIAIDSAIFSTAVYAPYASQLLQKLKVKPSSRDYSVDNHSLLRGLTDPSALIIAREDNSLSDRLNKDFSSSALHEQAALLLTALCLREESGYFRELRAELSRIMAHLTWAEVLRNEAPMTSEGILAEATLAALCNRQNEALRLLYSVSLDSPPVNAWKDMLQVRITGDYRILSKPDLTPLEKLEKFRAEADYLSVDQAARAVTGDKDLTGSVGWCRVVNANGATVELGHEVLRYSLGAEMSEVNAVSGLVTGQALTPENLASRLNEEPGFCIAPNAEGKAAARVISWGLWAGYFQRHLCHAVQNDFKFLQELWGVRDKAREYRDWADKTFGGLRLYPFVKRQTSTDTPYYRRAQDESMAVVRAVPHLVPSQVWNYICYTPTRGAGALYIPPPHAYINEWHRPNPLPGNAYNILPRLNHPSLTRRPDFSAVVARLQKESPYDLVLIRAHLLDVAQKAGRKDPTLTEVEKAYGPLAEYSSTAVYAIMKASSEGPSYEKWARKYASLDPSGWNYLGKYYVEKGREADAVTAFETMVAQDPDRVAIANSVGWLVDYYERRGESGNADRLANFAAKVYSYTGLETKARLLESRKRYVEALTYYEKISERYDATGAVLGFLMRIQDQHKIPELEARFTKLSQEIFPDGLQKVDLATLKGPPKKGVRLDGINALTRKYGLTTSDVIVGIRGILTPDTKSFLTVRDSLPNTAFILCLWRGDHYIEIKAAPPNNRFGVDLVDYPGG